MVQIAEIFTETANQEKEHAKRFFKFLEGGEVQITETFAAGQIQSTLENLRDAAAGEEHEWTEMYPAFAKVARNEGFEDVATAFEAICIAEKKHGKRYQELADNLEGEEAPEVCPACLHPQAHFELLGENW